MTATKQTILYSRLSREDERTNESLSIENQKAFLEEYAVKNGFTPFIHMVDDGFSGTTPNRPAWQEVIAKVENDGISVIIAKDSSRIMRDYVLMGIYRQMFRDKGVRLICVAENYDSANGTDDDLVPFKDIFAEWHARDTSRKIKAIFGARTANGNHVTGALPYGYIHDPNDRQKWMLPA